jgi:hypothetical protein
VPEENFPEDNFLFSFLHSMRFPRAVPWTSATEWRQVYRDFYPHSFGISEDRTEDYFSIQQRALKRTRTWQSRGRCPISVESTQLLLEAQHADHRQSDTAVASGDNHNELRLLYSLAIIRFVNGLVDQQQQAMYAMPVVQLAQSINLPRYFVDIRHSATHDKLPSLSVLRKAAKDALRWLEDNYWSIQDSYCDDLKRTCTDLLSKYKNSRKFDLKDDNSAAQLSDQSNRLIKDIVSICPNSLLREILIPVLVDQPGMLVPLNKK